MTLKDKVALVVGTSPNIGGGIAEGLAEAGAAIAAVDVRAENAADCADYINRTGGRAIGVAADARSTPSAMSPPRTSAQSSAARTSTMA